ncbi:hypothetical protein AMTRI_Chr03g138450 [Amborella trichopoda]
MQLNEREGIEGLTFVVTGGAGFVGSALCLELKRRGAKDVRALDPRTSSPWFQRLKQNGVVCLSVDVSQKRDVKKALREADCVFHVASYGMSGKEMLQVGHIDEVNITGTCHILDACLEFGIKRLVYVSTYNVVFGGTEIVNGNEALNYFLIDDHVDAYGRSKSIAEQLVLKSNGRHSKEKQGAILHTCAIRPAAIYGPGEERHVPRILNLAKMGLLPCKIGDDSVKSDWVYIDNLVDALLLASMALLDDIPGREGPPVASGQAYFINDGAPVNSFAFLRPLLLSLDYDFPKSTISVHHALILARICSCIYTLLYPWLKCSWLPQPLLPAEVYKVGVTHYFSPLKAKEELGYVPRVSPHEGMAATISYYQERKRKAIDGPTIFAWLFCIIGMSLLFCSAFIPHPYLGQMEWARSLHLFVFRSQFLLRIVFFVAVALHGMEAVYAWYLARRVDPYNANGWFWQTFLLGFFSLRFLLKRAKK